MRQWLGRCRERTAQLSRNPTFTLSRVFGPTQRTAPVPEKFSCKIVHLALTPLVGSPTRIVDGLNKHSAVKARLVTINDYTTGFKFPLDLRWWIPAEKEEALSLIETADVLHLHHWLDLNCHGLEIDFAGLQRKDTQIVRQFHSNPAMVASHNRTTVETILNDPLPQLTVPQFHERYYPRARLVPQIVSLEAAATPEPGEAIPGLRIYYRPTNAAPAFACRWDTKGAPDVLEVLRNAGANVPGVSLDCGTDPIPFTETLERRRRCNLAIDDAVTGSYHLTSLESMALGLACISHLDPRQVAVLTYFTGSPDLPFLNFSLEQLPALLRKLAADPVLVETLGQHGQAWMKRYWHPGAMTQHYVNAYRDVLRERGRESFGHPRFDLSDPAAIGWCKVRKISDGTCGGLKVRSPQDSPEYTWT